MAEADLGQEDADRLGANRGDRAPPVVGQCDEAEGRAGNPAEGTLGLPPKNLAEKRRQTALKAWAIRLTERSDRV